MLHIDAKIRDLRYQQRLEMITLVSQHDHPAERAEKANTLLRELSMQRVFDRFTKEQEAALFDLLAPIGDFNGAVTHPPYGLGAYARFDPAI